MSVHVRVGSEIGSSPRVRGTPSKMCAEEAARRFIPACAGNAVAGRFRPTIALVHPRVCGERHLLAAADQPAGGSSPRVRGTLWRDGRSKRMKTVHPRVCGERLAIRVGSTTLVGSSPRVRGTHLRHARSKRSGRFIPACAGNAPVSSIALAVNPVHPRVCGERASRLINRELTFGSSPRVRGTPCGRRSPCSTRRFIPACAGNALGDQRMTGTAIGSSPRVRGTRRVAHISVERGRFIPACAGNAACC